MAASSWRFVLVLSAATLLLSACQQAAPPAAPTKAPSAPATAVPAQPTAAPATAVPAQPTAAPATAVLAQPTAAPAAKVDFPVAGKSLTMVHPFAAGSASDAGARLLAPFIEKELGIPVQILNKPGAGGQIAYTELANAKPDGYTIGFTHLPGINTIYLDPERGATFTDKNFAPLAMWVYSPGGITVPVDSRFKTVKDLMDEAKANPEKVKVALTGKLSPYHLLLLELAEQYDTKFAIVFVDGAGQAVTQMLGGHLDAYPDAAGDTLPYVKNGQLRQLGIMDDKESKFFPGVKTMEALGYKMRAASSRGIAAPAGVPKEVISVLSNALKKAIQNPDHVAKMDEIGQPLRYMSPDEFATYWSTTDTWATPLVDKAKAQTN